MAMVNNIGLLALLSVLLTLVRFSHFVKDDTLQSKVLIGLVFGAAASIVMLNPIVIPQGATFDTRGGPAMLVAIFGGPISTLVAATIGAATRLYVGGGSAIGGAASFIFYGLAGLAAMAYLKQKSAKPNLTFFMLTAVLGTVAVLPAFFIGQSFELGITILRQAWWMLLGGNIAGVLILGFILEMDARRHAESQQLVEQQLFNKAVLDAEPAHVAVVDADGYIKQVNKAWHKYYEENGGTPKNWIGENYYSNCNLENEVPELNQLPEIINDIAIGRIGKFDQIYPCHSPTENKWYLLMVRPIEWMQKQGALLFHVDVTKEHQAFRDMELARENAEKANQVKSEFLSSMSHELRTPLNAILGFAQLIGINSSKSFGDDKLGDHANQIIKGGEHLLELIDQVLELSKIEAGKVSLFIEKVKPTDVIDECLVMVAGRASENNISISNQTNDAELPFLQTDKSRFRQVLLNVLSNAIKYNRPRGSVTITCELAENGFQRFSVVDTGKGISKDKLDGLFEPFNRLGRESGEIEGTGIGLTITKQIIELLGGNLGYQSEEDVGSTFWIDLPISDDQSPPKKNEIEVGGLVEIAEVANNKSRTLLYIEDNPANMKLMEAVIDRVDNLTMLSAPDAEIGLIVAKNQLPDLILMDINLPGMDGVETLEKLRSEENTKSIPVIALTAAAMPDEIERGKQAGFEAYITKPINVVEVLETINEHIG